MADTMGGENEQVPRSMGCGIGPSLGGPLIPARGFGRYGGSTGLYVSHAPMPLGGAGVFLGDSETLAAPLALIQVGALVMLKQIVP